ncbi:MAG TPA: phosphotransferase [Gaiellaceae bacterium]|nr:phosphotransferase [Gaiellaceae bacterium]
MATTSQLFAAVRHPREPALLFLRSDREWRLPRVVGARDVWGADAKMLVPLLERRLGTPLWLLRQLQMNEQSAVFELELRNADWSAPANARWIGRTGLAGLRLKDDVHRPLLEEYLGALEREDVPPERPPWQRPGWLGEVSPWLEREVARLGHTVVGLQQVKHWSISAVLRIQTDGPDLYFKVPARLPLFVEEASVTASLARRFPEHVPGPLAIEPERGWMLLPAFEELFGWDAPVTDRQDALRRFAGLQRRTAAQVDDLLADGCLDRRLPVLESQVDALVNDSEAVDRLSREEVAELTRLAPWLKDVCRRLATYDVPSTLVHGDLHMLNVGRLEGRLVYFDWTDACIGHPFIDLLCLSWEQDEVSRAAVLKAYLEPWQGIETVERLQEALELATVVIPLHHAVSYQHIAARLEPAAKPELDATANFLRRVLKSAEPLLAS